MDTRLHGFRVALLAALGLAPVGACGGSSEPGGNSGGDAGSPEAGNPTEETGGATNSGGRLGAGGAISTGGRPTTGTGGRPLSAGGAGIGSGGFFVAGGTIGVGASAGAIGQAASTSSGSGGATPGTGGGAGAGGHPKPCAPLPENANSAPPADRIVARPSTQFCEGGWRHRPVAATCPSSLPRAEPVEPVEPLEEGNCTEDADCTDREHGYCALSQGQRVGNFCQYGCVDSAECGEGYLCECGPLIGTCVPTNCQSDADCGDLLCASYTSNPGCNFPAFACQTAEDECTSDADCGTGFCTVVGDHRECQGPTCVIGRPFLIDGHERLARPEGRSDWFETESVPSLAEMAAPSRAALAEAWTRIGLMEHASIAAFARFTLELLALGAPAALVSASSSAMHDEISHARQAFALASAYAGAARGPGALDIDGSLCTVELEACAVNAFLEGCIGETVAALEAREAAELCRDPAVRRVLSRVADEEARHALLAFEFVKWALAESRSLGPTLERALEREITASAALERTATPPREDDATLSAHGILPESRRRSLRARVLEDVVAPCLTELRHNAATVRPEGVRLDRLPAPGEVVL